MIRGLTDVGPIGAVTGLRSLILQALRGVETLPDLSRCVALRQVRLETMKGLRSLKPLASAPARRDVVLIDMPQLAVDDLEPLRGIPTLRGVTLGLGSVRRNEA